MLLAALAAVAIGWLLRNYWLAFTSGLAVSFASAFVNSVVYADRPDLNDFQFRTILAGFLAGALGVVVAFLRTAYDEYRLESLEAEAGRPIDSDPGDAPAQPRMSATVWRRLKRADARTKRFGTDIGALTSAWIGRATYRDAGPK